MSDEELKPCKNCDCKPDLVVTQIGNKPAEWEYRCGHYGTGAYRCKDKARAAWQKRNTTCEEKSS